jgi:hypothetical protein
MLVALSGCDCGGCVRRRVAGGGVDPALLHDASKVALFVAILGLDPIALTARRTQVTIKITMAPMDTYARARSVARRYDSGLLIVDIEIPPASQDFTELLAHELEHASEIIERVDFEALAGARLGQRVDPDGSSKSDRATRKLLP